MMRMMRENYEHGLYQGEEFQYRQAGIAIGGSQLENCISITGKRYKAQDSGMTHGEVVVLVHEKLGILTTISNIIEAKMTERSLFSHQNVYGVFEGSVITQTDSDHPLDFVLSVYTTSPWGHTYIRW